MSGPFIECHMVRSPRIGCDHQVSMRTTRINVNTIVSWEALEDGRVEIETTTARKCFVKCSEHEFEKKVIEALDHDYYLRTSSLIHDIHSLQKIS